jgi:hypothetical protein
MIEKKKYPPESLRAILFHNPIADMEYRLLSGGKRRPTFNLSYAVLILLALSPFFVSLFDGVDGYYHHSVNSTISFSLIWMGIALLVNSVLTLITTLHTSSGVFAREHIIKTFDGLLLTGMSARKILIGKWMGCIRHFTADYFYLFCLRSVVLFWTLALIITNGYAWEARDSLTFSQIFQELNYGNFFLLSLANIWLLSTELFFSTALGMVVVNILKKRAREVAVVATRVMIPLGLAFVFGLVVFYIPTFIYPPTAEIETYSYTDRNGTLQTHTYVTQDWDRYYEYTKSINQQIWGAYFLFSLDNGTLAVPVVSDVMHRNTQYDIHIPLADWYFGLMLYSLCYFLMGIQCLRLGIRYMELGGYPGEFLFKRLPKRNTKVQSLNREVEIFA